MAYLIGFISGGFFASLFWVFWFGAMSKNAQAAAAIEQEWYGVESFKPESKQEGQA